MTLLQVINTLVIITTLSYLLETQWTFYKMKPSTINRIYQPLIQKPEVDEAEFNTRLSPSLDIDLKNMHLLENAEKLEATPKGDTMEGFYRKFLKSSLSLSSLKCDNTQPYTQEMSHLHRMHQQTQMENGEPQQQQEEDQECTKCSFFKFIWYSLKRSFFPKSPSTVSLDLSMLEDRFKDIEYIKKRTHYH